MEQPPELSELLNRIHALYCKEVEIWRELYANGGVIAQCEFGL